MNRSGRRLETRRPPAALPIVAALVLWTVGACADAGSGRGTGEARAGAGSASARPPAAADSARAVAADSTLRALGRELLPAAEAGSGIEAREPVQLARAGRGRLEAFLTEQLRRDLPPAEADAVTAAYARLGLLDADLELLELLRSLYLEQVVGYYDPEVDTLFVRDGVGADRLRPVLLHETVHALQDQVMDLDSTLAARRDDNDALTAAQAALEGHATFVMTEWMLRESSGREVDLTALSELPQLLEGLDPGQAAGMPELAGAPRLIRESLLFPYLGGLTFLQQVWRERPAREPPLGVDLPASTEQVLHPDRYLGERDVPGRVAYPGEPPPGWIEVHQDGLGEFEVRHLLETFLADTARARSAAAGWDGDRYRLLRAGEDGGEVLVWVSLWDEAGEAREFAEAVAAAFEVRYGDSARVVTSGREGGPDGASDGAAPEGRGPSEAPRRVEVRLRAADDVPRVVVLDRPAGLDRALSAALWRHQATGEP